MIQERKLLEEETFSIEEIKTRDQLREHVKNNNRLPRTVKPLKLRKAAIAARKARKQNRK